MNSEGRRISRCDNCSGGCSGSGSGIDSGSGSGSGSDSCSCSERGMTECKVTP